MATFRTIKQDGDFVLVHKTFIYDDQLSARAKGILLYLLSRPNDWQIYTSEVQKHMKDGVKSVNSAVNELIRVGYIKRTLKRSEKGTFKGYEYLVYETPTEMPLTENGQTENGLTENGQTENRQRHTTNNNSTNNDLTNNNNTNNDNRLSGNPTIPYQSIIEYLNSKAGKQYKSTTNKTQTVIKARWNEGFQENDFRQVINTKVSEWKGTDMEKYLRPETLFGTKFESYLNQEVSNKGADDNPYANLF
ncbi:conserved phage C-terminal domain-containing protein [Staphylococcus arlettae]